MGKWVLIDSLKATNPEFEDYIKLKSLIDLYNEKNKGKNRVEINYRSLALEHYEWRE